MEKVTTSPATHLKSLPAEIRQDATALHKLISSEMKGLPCALWTGTLWGGSRQQIIGYGDYTYTRSDGAPATWFMVGFGVQKKYISVYVNAVDGRQYLAEKYKKRLGRVKVGRSNISFKRLADVDSGSLRELIARARRLMAP
jgi:hypothetical protein